MWSSTVLILSLYSIISCIHVVQSHIITLDPHQEECFHERLTKGTKVKFYFEVIDGGSLDIELSIKDPNGAVIHTEQGQSSGRYTIEANQDGAHTYCFGNKYSSAATKILMFNVEFHEAKKASDEESDRLQNMITELVALVTGVKHEMDFMAGRDALHRSIDEKTNSRVAMWSLMEIILVLVVAVGQIYYVKRFFEVRRRV